MSNFDQCLQFVRDLIGADDSMQLKKLKLGMEENFGEKATLQCFQLLTNPNFTHKHVAESLLLSQFSKPTYSDEEIEKMLQRVVTPDLSEAEFGFLVTELEKRFPLVYDYLFEGSRDMSLTTKEIIKVLNSKDSTLP